MFLGKGSRCSTFEGVLTHDRVWGIPFLRESRSLQKILANDRLTTSTSFSYSHAFLNLWSDISVEDVSFVSIDGRNEVSKL